MFNSNKDNLLSNVLISKTSSGVKEYALPTKTIFFGTVVENEDPKGSRRIKVRIDLIDDDIIETKDLKWCIPVLPPFIHFIPKIGESVLIMLQNPWTNSVGRFYVGPIMSRDETDMQSKQEMYDGFDIKNVRKNP